MVFQNVRGTPYNFNGSLCRVTGSRFQVPRIFTIRNTTATGMTLLKTKQYSDMFGENVQLFDMDLLKTFFALRYVSIIAVISSFIGSVLLFILGALKIAGAIAVIILGGEGLSLLTEIHGPESATSAIVLLVINSIDMFLFALVLLIFSYGIYELFVRTVTAENLNEYPSWIKIRSIGQLKNYLAQVIITILFVQFLEIVIVNGEKLLSWEAVVLPVAILCLAGAVYFMQAGHAEE